MSTPSTRVSLLLRLRDPHDHDAWMDFVSLYESVILRLLRTHGLQDADARDVMQELFLAVSGSIDRWDAAKEAGSFRGCLSSLRSDWRLSNIVWDTAGAPSYS
jgi:RNA polymerase sigma-70 factor, ECF subfamily